MKSGEKWRLKKKYLNDYDDIYAITSMLVEIVHIMPWGDVTVKVLQSEFIYESEEVSYIKEVHQEEELFFPREEFLEYYERVYE